MARKTGDPAPHSRADKMSKEDLQEELRRLLRRLQQLEKRVQTCRDVDFSTQAANALLRLLATATSRQEYLRAATRLLQLWSGCRYVGIRVLNQQGQIPYEAYLGFSREFWESENWLSIHSDQCICIRVISSRTESQDVARMTRGGSFYVDNSREFLQGLTKEQQQRYRGACVKCGFKSIAIIPLISRGTFGGLIHLADDEGGKLHLNLVEFLEEEGFFIGQALQKFDGGSEDAFLESYLRLLMECSRDCLSILSPAGGYLALNLAGYLAHRLDGPAALAGKALLDGVTENREAVAQALRAAAAGEEVNVRHQSRDQFGREVGWESSLVPVKRLDGAIPFILTISRDITARGEKQPAGRTGKDRKIA